MLTERMANEPQCNTLARCGQSIRARPSLSTAVSVAYCPLLNTSLTVGPCKCMRNRAYACLTVCYCVCAALQMAACSLSPAHPHPASVPSLACDSLLAGGCLDSKCHSGAMHGTHPFPPLLLIVHPLCIVKILRTQRYEYVSLVHAWLYLHAMHQTSYYERVVPFERAFCASERARCQHEAGPLLAMHACTRLAHRSCL